jgi:cobalt-zinc-cadmium efflux system outer membrane protein
MFKRDEKNRAGCYWPWWYLILFLLVVFGCAQPPRQPLSPPSRALGSGTPTFKAPAEASIDAETPRRSEPEGDLSLRSALALSLLQNPNLAAFSWEARAREAEILQAAVVPNPEISVEAENFAGSGSFDGYDRAETTVMLGQLIELGGKRAKRRRTAELERDLADWDYEVRRLDVLTAVAKEFVHVLEAQGRVALADELSELASESLVAVSKRVRAGAASLVEETRAKVNLSSAKVDARRAGVLLAAARSRLAALWGAEFATFLEARGQFDSVAVPPSLESTRGLLENNPDVARWTSELALRDAVVDLEDARRISNVTIGGGIRHFEEEDDSALVLGVTIPFPIFDRNQGARQAARLRRSRVRSEELASRTVVASRLAIAHQSLLASYETILELRGEVLPQAEEAYLGVRTGYLRGLFRYLDVLDAQRTLFELRDRELTELGRFHRSVAEVERLTGTPLASRPNASPDRTSIRRIQ